MIKYWQRNFMWTEPTVVGVLLLSFVVWVERFGGECKLLEVLDGNRAAIYGTLASVFGSLLGFVLTAVSIIIAFSAMEQLGIIRESAHYLTLYRIYIQATWLLALATLIAVLGLIIDRDHDPSRPLLYASALASGL